MNNKIIKWGIIGCGDVTEVKSGPAFNLADNSELIAVMRRTGTLAEDYARRHNVPKWYDNADDLINDPEVDAVYIATPPSSHKDYTLAVAKASKIVYVEKPMALNYSECLEMIDKCEKMNVPLFVAYYRRALPRFVKIKEIISSGIIGDICSVEITFLKKPSENDIQGKSNWRVDPSIAGGGYFYDLASHQIDILQFYLGDIIDAKGFKVNQSNLYEAEDAVTASLHLPDNIIGSGIWNFNSYKEIDRTEIMGTKGSIVFSTFDNEPITIETNKGIEKISIANQLHIQLPLIQKIVNELLGKDKSPSTGYTGAQTNKVIDWIFAK
jgi:predicted dehydrogenase